jgi:hypothetical protein
MKFRAVSAALAVSMMVAAPAAAAQETMTGAQARAEMERYCSQNAQRTDEAGRAWHAANCTAEALARYDVGMRSGGTGAVTAIVVGLAAAAIAIFVK